MTDTCTIIVAEGSNHKVLDNIPCAGSIDVQKAMELAYERHHVAFSLTYYGNNLGYFVQSLDGIPNTSVTSWFLYEFGSETPVGIDGVKLKAGDTVEFRYEFWNDEKHAGTVYAKKRELHG